MIGRLCSTARLGGHTASNTRFDVVLCRGPSPSAGACPLRHAVNPSMEARSRLSCLETAFSGISGARTRRHPSHAPNACLVTVRPAASGTQTPSTDNLALGFCLETALVGTSGGRTRARTSQCDSTMSRIDRLWRYREDPAHFGCATFRRHRAMLRHRKATAPRGMSSGCAGTRVGARVLETRGWAVTCREHVRATWKYLLRAHRRRAPATESRVPVVNPRRAAGESEVDGRLRALDGLRRPGLVLQGRGGSGE